MLMTLISGAGAALRSILGLSVCIGIDKTERDISSPNGHQSGSNRSRKATYESPVVIYTDEGENIRRFWRG